MTRAEMVEFCANARCEIEGIEDIDECIGVHDDYNVKTDEFLRREVDFLEEMLGK